MLGTTFYNESIRKALVAFGTLFNNITIKRSNTSGDIQSYTVPLAYAPRARFLQDLAQGAANAEVQYTLPRLSFEWTSLTYDSMRKLNTMQKTAITYKTLTFTADRPLFQVGETITGGTSAKTAYVIDQPAATTMRIRDASGTFTDGEVITGSTSGFTATLISSSAEALDSTKVITFWQRVPYNLDISLALGCETTEDGLRVVEQILPYFTPELTVSINDVMKHDMPIILMDVSQEDQWEGGLTGERRFITWTLNFQMKTYLYGPAKDSGLVTEAITQMYSNIFNSFDDTQSALDKANIRITQVPNPVTADADDASTVTKTLTDNV